MSLTSFVASAFGRPGRALPVSDHCDGERFFNPSGQPARPLGDATTWQRTRETSPWPESVPLTAYPPPPPVVPGAIAATFVGHSTFLLRTTNAVILTDPMFATHAGPFGRLGPRRVHPPALPLDSLPIPDIVLVSHNHYDHLQPSSLRRCTQGAEPQFVTALGLGPFLRRMTLQNVIELDWWQEADLGDGRTVTCVPAQHFSGRTPFDGNRTLWCGFVLRTAAETIYFAGDSGYGPHFTEIGRRCPSIDLALLPIGAYEPRSFMRPVQMNPAEAVQAHLDVGARVSLGMHFGTFQLSDEAIDEPLLALGRALDDRDIPDQAFTTLDFGESVVVPPVRGRLD
jgi:L-ascorbate metabolism protein UlaG (beta-lactamase superfamily)